MTKSGAIFAFTGQVCVNREKNLFMWIWIRLSGECACIQKKDITADPPHPAKDVPGAKPERVCFMIHGILKRIVVLLENMWYSFLRRHICQRTNQIIPKGTILAIL